MSIMKWLYVATAVVAVALAVSVEYWLPAHWGRRPARARNANAGKDDAPSAARDADAGATVLSRADVAAHDGVANPGGALYLVVLGEVFDVTAGERFYAPGNGYHGFVGRDNSAAFHTGKFNESAEDVRALPPNAVASVVGWRSFFRKHATYTRVGVVEGLYYDAAGAATAALADVERAAGAAASGEAEDARRATLFPRCNMHYDGIKKQTLVWCEGYKEASDVAGKWAADTERRVLRMVQFVSQASGETQRDCRCLREGTGEADVGSEPFPSARVEYYFKERGCDPALPRCLMKVD
jgi:hypothetical protein